MTTGSYLGFERRADGVYRLYFATASVTAANQNIVRLCGARTAAASETGDVYIGGVQAEDRATPSSYVPTTSGTATRAREAFSVPWDYLPQSGSWLFDFFEMGSASTPNYGVFQLGGSTASSGAYLSVYASGTAGRYLLAFSNGVDSVVSTTIGASGAVAFGDRVRIRVVLDDDGAITLGVKINDDDEVTSSATAPASGLPEEWGEGSGTRMYFGILGSTNAGLTALVGSKAYQRSMSMTELIAA